MDVLTENRKAGIFTLMLQFQEGVFNNAFDTPTEESPH